ncbi:type II secretion system F family protein [Thalassoglobus sp.]|uniref:type II secretion system F family protein n=1 Tax=Thalassoglobus sp. TaxID=2795869 RepID=UPI003AA8A4BC
MNSSEMIFFAIAVGATMAIYAIYKFWKRGKKSVDANRSEPKMRPKGTSRLREDSLEPVAKQEPSSPSVPAIKDEPQHAEEVEQPAIAQIEESSPQRDNVPAATLFSTEGTKVKPGRINEVKVEGVEEEYPYFDQSDYKFGKLTPLLAAMMPTSKEGRETIKRALRNAGYYSPHAWHNLTAVRYLCMVAPILFFGFLLVIVPTQLETSVIIALLVCTGLGWALPSLYVRAKAKDRLREIGNGMPDMLDLLNMCVSQGMTVISALGRVGRDIAPVYPALSKELKIVTDQAHVGTLSQSLSNLSDRVDLPEVHSFSSLLVQTDQMGTSVSEALSEYSDNMRESMKQRADEKANSATFKLLFPTVLCLMPAVYLFLLGPAVVELNRFYEDGGSDALSTEIPDQFTGG